MLKAQVKFNGGKFVDYESVTTAAKQQLTKDYVLHLLDECHEVLRSVNWKMHRGADEAVDVFALKVELIDVLKFWGNIAALWDCGDAELHCIFMHKTKIVAGKYDLAHRPPPTGPVIGVDHKAFMVDIPNAIEQLKSLHDKYDASLLFFNVSDSRDKFFLESYFIGDGIPMSSQHEPYNGDDCSLIVENEEGAIPQIHIFGNEYFGVDPGPGCWVKLGEEIDKICEAALAKLVIKVD